MLQIEQEHTDQSHFRMRTKISDAKAGDKDSQDSFQP